MGCLYRLTSPSGKSYIGATSKTAEVRFLQHLRDARNPRTRRLIGRALEKYGASNFVIETLVVSNDMDYLKELEVRAITVFKTLWPKGGYNGCAGGNGAISITKEAERRRLENMRRTMATPEYKDKQRTVQAIVWGKERRADRAEKIKLMWQDPAYRAHMVAIHTGKTQTQESKDKRRQAMLGRKRISK